MTDNDWICSVCKKVPKVMHSIEPNICVGCYEASEPGPPPTYNEGDRVTTPGGEGRVVYIIPGDDDRTSSVCVYLDSARNYSLHYKGTTYLAELVKPAAKKRRR